MHTFADLVASRKAWIEAELKPWCVGAAHNDLRMAAEAWSDIAGRVDLEKTLWFWAWSRFPDLVNAELQTIDETRGVRVTLHDGRVVAGFPDARASREGYLVLLGSTRDASGRFNTEGPFRLDEIGSIHAATVPSAG